ncbi:MAG TPA: alpha/beta hydrolase [Acidothermaceae bacterium]|jgi:acetyl esterase|nr:alpha/beta hydrolase [Acidothermaceae bacterium]
MSDQIAGRDVPVPHEQVLAYLRTVPSTADSSSDIQVLRARTRAEALAVRGELEPVASIQTLDVGGVPARLYRPHGDETDVLIWIHGGGWIHGDLDCYEGVARALANRGNCAVLAIDYRLAPEHPFPAGFDDAWTAVQWAKANFANVAVAGDSSGGNLAAAVALSARDRGVELALQLLVYPVLDNTAATAYKQLFRERYSNFAGHAGFGVIADERIHHLWDLYVPDVADREMASVSPPRAESFRDLAPAVIITAEHDILRGEVEEYARRLEADGVPVAAYEYIGQIHGFFQMLGVMADAEDAIDKAAAALRHAFAVSTESDATAPTPRT